jgi:ubiquinol-cytochrome c reductase cytochrome c subunit
MSTARLAAWVLSLCCVAGAGLLLAERPARAEPVRRSATPDGRQIWLRDCAVCHRADGSGSAKAPDLRHVGIASFDFMISTGRMPLSATTAKLTRHQVKYSKAEIDALVRYASTLTTGPSVPTVRVGSADLAKGSELYSENCSSCHQAAGGGGALAFGQVAPALRHASAVQVVEAIRTGPGTMPKFGHQSLSDVQATQIAAYVQELRHPDDRGGAGLGHLGPVPEGLVAWIVGLGVLLIVARLLGTRNLRQAAHAPATSEPDDS